MGAVFSSNTSKQANQRPDQNAASAIADNKENKGLRYTLTHDAAGFFTCGLFVVGVVQAALFFQQLRSK
jgi:hypothetical protein